MATSTSLLTGNLPVTDLSLLKLAREIAQDIHELDDILAHHNINQANWEQLQQNPRFISYLESETASWNAALNTQERVRIKAAAAVEEWLPELYARVHDAGENLSAKVEAGKLLRDLAGFSKGGVGMEATGERFSVTINLGTDNQLRFEKEVTPKVIDHEELD
jgi:hypothetical protein